jgi:NADH-quinone oxidoreductase subunit C
MKAKLPRGAALDQGASAGDEWVTVSRERLQDVLGGLKAQGYEQLSFLSCVDHLASPVLPAPPQRFELVYQLLRMQAPTLTLRVRCFVPEDDARAPSVCEIYPPALWEERETYDMFGIVFDGHPALTRLLMPDDWVGHPLRRDYPVGGEPVDFSEEIESWQTAPPRA